MNVFPLLAVLLLTLVVVVVDSRDSQSSEVMPEDLMPEESHPMHHHHRHSHHHHLSKRHAKVLRACVTKLYQKIKRNCGECTRYDADLLIDTCDADIDDEEVSRRCCPQDE